MSVGVFSAVIAAPKSEEDRVISFNSIKQRYECLSLREASKQSEQIFEVVQAVSVAEVITGLVDRTTGIEEERMGEAKSDKEITQIKLGERVAVLDGILSDIDQVGKGLESLQASFIQEAISQATDQLVYLFNGALSYLTAQKQEETSSKKPQKEESAGDLIAQLGDLREKAQQVRPQERFQKISEDLVVVRWGY